MPDKKSIAIHHFFNGYNCSQSVVAAFADISDVPKEKLLKLACGFGGGMGRLGETCGAVTGAYMVIGLKHGQEAPDDGNSRECTYTLVQNFETAFKARHHTTCCLELLGCSLRTPEGQEKFKDEDLKNKICSPCVESAVGILESIL
ncbi:C-GCAxxG-C-C family protein [Alkaliflexus imshenetskii]|uniref:C-GCAxxG-C-C family protein n=1 Tax=Alkaliflexus imshenetskii TaxID=286730 RepID=UPI00047C0CDC|nr:C-GCAxxG-C-C family protein [Alkaliflexus imshenetskii]